MVAWKLNYKIIVYLIVFFSFSKVSFTQNLQQFIPLESKRSDILKALENQNKQILQDGTIQYDFQNHLIKFKFYNGSCDYPKENIFGISKDTLIQITDSPKIMVSATDYMKGNYDKYQILEFPDGKVYISSKLGVYLKETQQNNQNTVSTVIYFPDLVKIQPCLINELDQNIRLLFDKSNNFSSSPNNDYFYETTYLRSTKDYWNKFILDSFIQFLKGSVSRKGYIIVYSSNKSKLKKTQLWIDKLKTYLFSENKINVEKIDIIDGGYREYGMAELFVLYNSDPAPKSTPTILPSKFKLAKDKRKTNK